MQIKKTAALTLFSLSIFMLVACSSVPHRIADEDLSAEWSGQAYSNLLLIGTYTDRPTRVSAEVGFSELLKEKGVRATPSYDLIPDLASMEDNLQVAEKLASLDYDGVLVVATTDEGYEYDTGDYFATRGMVYLLGGEPGEATDLGAMFAWAGSGQYEMYVGLWDSKSAKPVWQITTNSSDSGSEAADTKALADFIVDMMREKGLL